VKYSVAVTSAPAAEPLTRAQAKLHLKVDVTDDDDLIDALIQAAREWTENYCRRSLVRRTLKLYLDCWPEEIRLPRGPVSSVSSVTYTDANGNATTLSASQYQVDLNATPPRIVRAPNVAWPVLQPGVIAGVQVTYLAGYDPDSAARPIMRPTSRRRSRRR
jgi:uncharacterized phiE125 gp8 family phage protein